MVGLRQRKFVCSRLVKDKNSLRGVAKGERWTTKGDVNRTTSGRKKKVSDGRWDGVDVCVSVDVWMRQGRERRSRDEKEREDRWRW